MCMEQTFGDLKTTQTMYMCFFAAIILILCAAFLPQTKSTMYMNIFSILILLCVVYLNIKQTLDLQKANREIGEQPDHIRTQINMNIVYSYFFTFSLGLLIVFAIRNMLTAFQLHYSLVVQFVGFVVITIDFNQLTLGRSE